MADVLTVADLELAKKHDTFHSEVITGKAGGSAIGAEIDTATNAATGQIQTTLPKVLRDVGFKPASFNFVTGGTLGIADADKCIYNPAPAGDDNWYSWGGVLPHAVAPGTDPTLPGSGYVPRTDVLLRNELAGDGSQVIIAGATAESIALVSRGDDYTYIQDSASRISKLFIDPTQSDKSIVITGDSLSVGGFGYPDGLGINGAGYATDNPFGMSSWAHMIRDAIVSLHPSFAPIEKCQLDTTGEIAWPSSNSDFIQFGMNAKVAIINFSSTAKTATMYSEYPGQRALIVSYALADESCIFNVNGVEVDNTTPDGRYLGRGYMLIPVSTPNITITNVRKKSDGSAGALAIYGCGSPGMTVANLTGKGAWTSGQILAEYSTLVAPYSPDVIFYIIGANDIGFGAPISEFSSNVRAFISAARAAKPGCEIILLSTPPCSSYTRSFAKPYIKEMLSIAKDTGSSIIDMWSKLEDIPVAEWRWDNIHFNTKGDALVFDIIKRAVFSSVDIDREKFFPVREMYLGAAGYFFWPHNGNKPVACNILCGSTPTKTASFPVRRKCDLALSYVNINGIPALDVTFPPGALIESISPLVRSFASGYIRAELYEIISDNRWQIVGINSAGNQVSLSSTGLNILVKATLLA